MTYHHILPTILLIVVLSDFISFFIIRLFVSSLVNAVAIAVEMCLTAWITTTIGISLGFSLSKWIPKNKSKQVSLWLGILSIILISLSCLILMFESTFYFQRILFITGNNIAGIFLGLLNYQKYLQTPLPIISFPKEISAINKTLQKKSKEINFDEIFNDSRFGRARKSSDEKVKETKSIPDDDWQEEILPKHSRNNINYRRTSENIGRPKVNRYEQNMPNFFEKPPVRNTSSDSNDTWQTVLVVLGVVVAILWAIKEFIVWSGSWLITCAQFFILSFLTIIEKYGPSLAQLLGIYIKAYPYTFGTILLFLLGFLMPAFPSVNSEYYSGSINLFFFAIGFSVLSATFPPTWIIETFILLLSYLRIVITKSPLRKKMYVNLRSPGYYFEYTGDNSFPFLENYLQQCVSIFPTRYTFEKLIYVGTNAACLPNMVNPLLKIMKLKSQQRIFAFNKLSPGELKLVAGICYQVERRFKKDNFLSELLNIETEDEPVLVTEKLVFLIKRDPLILNQSLDAINRALLQIVSQVQSNTLTDTETELIKRNLPFFLELGSHNIELEIFKSTLYLYIFCDYENALDRILESISQAELKPSGVFAFGQWIDSPKLRTSSNASEKLLNNLDQLIENFRSVRDYELIDNYFLKIARILTIKYPRGMLDKIMIYSRVDRWRKLCVLTFDGWVRYLTDNFSSTLLNSVYDSKCKYLEAISALDEASPGSLFIRRLVELRLCKDSNNFLEDVLVYSDRVPDRAGLLAEPLSDWLNQLSEGDAFSLFRKSIQETSNYRIIQGIQTVEKGQENADCLNLLYRKAIKQDPTYSFFAILYLGGEKKFKETSAKLILDWTDCAPNEKFDDLVSLLVGNSSHINLLKELDEYIYVDDTLFHKNSERFTSGPQLVISRLLFIISLNFHWSRAIDYAEKLVRFGCTNQVRLFFEYLFEKIGSEGFDVIRNLMSKKTSFSPVFLDVKSDPRLVIKDHPTSIWDAYINTGKSVIDLEQEELVSAINEIISVLSRYAGTRSGQETVAFFNLCSILLMDPLLHFNYKENAAILSSWPVISEIYSACDLLTKSVEKIPINRRIDWESGLAALTYQISRAESSYVWPESGLLTLALQKVIQTWSQKYENLKLLAEFKPEARPLFRSSGDVTYIDFSLIIRNIGLHSARNVRLNIMGNEYIDIRQYKRDEVDEVETEKSFEKQVYAVALKPGFKTVDITLEWDDGSKSRRNQKYSVEVTRPFVKIFNPYTPGSAVDNPAIFVGRENEIKRLIDGVTYPNQKKNFMIIGPSRMGKSSLLLQFMLRADNSYLPINIDFLETSIEKPDLVNFFWFIGECIYKSIKKFFPTVPEPNFGIIQANPSSGLKNYVTDQVMPIVGKNLPIVIIIDEFNWLTTSVLANRIPSEIFFFLRHLLEDTKWPRMILAGNINPIEVNFPESREILKSCDRIQLRELSFDQTAELIQSPLAGQVDVDEPAVKKIYYYTNGHPYLVQYICSSLVNLINEKNHSYRWYVKGCVKFQKPQQPEQVP